MLLNKEIAIIGNPNTGKSTIFNALTGLNQKIGNWSGVTVDKFEGKIKLTTDTTATIVDLPGIYGFSANSMDEKVVVDYLKNTPPDLLLMLIDGSNLERNLYLTFQILEKKIPTLIVVNMLDLAENSGISINLKSLSEMLQCPVIGISAKSKPSIEELKAKIYDCLKNNKNNFSPLYEIDSDKLKLASNRWELAKDISQKVSQHKHINNITAKLDKIFLNKYLGFPLFALLFYIMFNLVFLISDPIVAVVEYAFSYLAEKTLLLHTNYGVNEILVSFLNNAILGGVGTVVALLPVIFVVFVLFSLLENSGYLVRGVFLLDRLMNKFGMSGQGFLPMILGLGCSVPAFMSARSLKNERDRLLTIMMVPFMSCSARLPVYALFTSVFFPNNAGTIVFSLYVAGVVIGLVVIKIFSMTIFKGEKSWLVMELPVYHIPSLFTAVFSGFNKMKTFSKRIAYIIIWVTAFIWILSVFPLGVEYASNESLLGMIGSWMEPALAMAGYGFWQAGIALITGLLAKEVVIATLGTLLAEPLELSLQILMTPLAAYSFLVMVLLYAPCMSALITLYKETNWRWTLFYFIFSTILAFATSVLVYQIGSLFI